VARSRGRNDGGRRAPVLAIASTLAYLLVTMTYPVIAGRLLGTTLAPAPLRITHLDGQGVLRDVLSQVTNAGFAVSDLNFRRHDEDAVVVDVHTAETDPD
jgi:putative Mg2+ transporter-C (MgtC) family protein